MSAKRRKQTVKVNLSDSPETAAEVLFDGLRPVLTDIFMRTADSDYGVRFLAFFTARVIGFFAGAVGPEAALFVIRRISLELSSELRRQH